MDRLHAAVDWLGARRLERSPPTRQVSFARASGRHFAKYLSAFLFFIGYVIAAFTNRHQALHDMLAGTVVRQD